MYFPMDLKFNPTGKSDIEERCEEMMAELAAEMGSAEGEADEESFDASPSPELEALLPYYNQVEDEALKVARKYFTGTFVADARDVHNQKLFEYEQHGHTYRCYVDIYNENDNEINIIEVKATTNSKYLKNKKAEKLLDRFSDVGKYPHDLAFQRFVIGHALKEKGDNRRVNYYLAVLNSEYVYDGALDSKGECVYNTINGQDIVVFMPMNDTTKAYQPFILNEIATLERYIA